MHGYTLGCDDYISKPFSLAELYAKVTALIRRANGTIRNEIMATGSINLNPYRCTVFVNEEELVQAISRTILELYEFSYGVQNIDEGVVFWFKFN